MNSLHKIMNAKLITKAPARLLAIGLIAIVATGCASSGGAKSKILVTEEKRYIRLNHVQDTSQLDLKKGDSLAMVCTKCKTVWYQSPASAANPFFYPPPLRGGIVGDVGWQRQRWAFHDWERRHYCAGCKSTVTTTGSWKDSKESIKHRCDSCGDDSVFCCATQKDAPATEGMAPRQ